MIDSLPGLILHEPMPDYLENSQVWLTSHLLNDFITRGPATYIKKVTGHLDDPDSPAFRFGRAVHTLILEGPDAYNAQYVLASEVGAPVNPGTGKPFGPDSKKFKNWYVDYEATDNRDLIWDDEYVTLMNMRRNLHNRPDIVDLLMDTEREAVARTTIGGIKVQCRFDAIKATAIPDVKTCRSMDMFMGQVVEYGYLHQAAMYTAIARTLWGINPAFYFIVLEKQVPNRVALWRIDDNVIMDYYHNPRNLKDIIPFLKRMELFSGCVESDVWPDEPIQQKPTYDRERVIVNTGYDMGVTLIGDVESSGRK